MNIKKCLLVEGNDDYHVILNLQGARGIRILDKGEILDKKGIATLLEDLPTRLKASQGGIVGVMLDADMDLAARWSSVRNILVKAGYESVVDQPAAKGTILSPPEGTLLPRFGVWLMPNNLTNGILEDFLQFLVPAGDDCLPIARRVVQELPTPRFSPTAKSKAIMHTYLAWQEEPGKPFGQAVSARYLDATVAEAEDFVAWLRDLYQP
jgi:hypothetical protein